MTNTQVVALMATVLRMNPNGDGIGNQASINSCVEEAEAIFSEVEQAEKEIESARNAMK